jgi:hypothetical protein
VKAAAAATGKAAGALDASGALHAPAARTGAASARAMARDARARGDSWPAAQHGYGCARFSRGPGAHRSDQRRRDILHAPWESGGLLIEQHFEFEVDVRRDALQFLIIGAP